MEALGDGGIADCCNQGIVRLCEIVVEHATANAYVIIRECAEIGPRDIKTYRDLHL